jgi:hypothetical protein
MPRIIVAGRFAALLSFACLSTFAGATAQRTFVAHDGVDGPLCPISAPCRQFAAAVAATSSGGEVIVLDSAGYGPVTITQSVSIIAPAGIHAGISVFSGNGVTVNAPGATVVLRGLSINGQGGGSGIQFAQGARLRIENCVVANLTSAGIVQNASGSEMIVQDTIVRDNGGAGILVIADGTALLNHVRVEHNAVDGLYVVPSTTGATVNITHSIFAYNGANGIRADTAANAKTFMQVESSNVTQNGAAGFTTTASQSGAVAFATLRRSTFIRNGGDGIFASSTNPGHMVGIVSENDVSTNGADGIHVSGTADIRANANSGGNNVGIALHCDSALSGIRTLGNNAVDNTGSIGGCMFPNPAY